MSGARTKAIANDERVRYVSMPREGNVMDALAKVCIAVTAAGVIGIFSSTIQMRSDVAVIGEKVGKLEQKTALTSNDLTAALQPMQQTVGQHTADLAENKKLSENLDKRVAAIESDLTNIRRDIGTITDVLRTGQSNEQNRRR